MENFRSFIAGFLSTLIFHQGVLGLLYMLSISPRAPYNFNPTGPLGVPSVISLAFFGGLWGWLIWRFVAKHTFSGQIIRSLIYGAIGPTLIALTVVLPLKGMEFKPILIPFGLILNGSWGFGLWILMYLSRTK